VVYVETMAANNGAAGRSVAETLFGSGAGQIQRPVLLDEVNFPLKRVFVASYKSDKESPDYKFSELIAALKESHPELLSEIQLIGLDKPRSREVTIKKGQYCQASVDTRDYFRVFQDFNNLSQNNLKILTPLSAKGTGIAEECKNIDKCNTNTFNTVCHNYLVPKFNELMSEVRDDDVKHVAYYKKESTFDALGNLIVSPPTREKPFGCIIYGTNSVPSGVPTYKWKPGCDVGNGRADCTKTFEVNFQKLPNKQFPDFEVKSISGAFKDILNKFTDQPQVPVYTGWLEVGHIDEIVSFIPYEADPSDPEDPGFRMMIASPGQFLTMWAAEREKPGCLFKKTFEAVGSSMAAYSRDPFVTGKFSAQNIKEGAKTIRQSSGNSASVDRITEKMNASIFGFQPAAGNCNILKTDFANPRMAPLKSYNQYLQDHFLDNIKTYLCTKIGLPERFVIDVPILYMGPDEIFNLTLAKLKVEGYEAEIPAEAVLKLKREFGLEGAPDDPFDFFNYIIDNNLDEVFVYAAPYIYGSQNMNFGTYHLSDCFINSLYNTTFIIGPEISTDIGIEGYLEGKILSGRKIQKIFYLDDWRYVKYQHGGIHCFTSELRDYSRAPEVFARFAGAANAVRPANAGSNFGLTGLFGNSGGGARRKNTRRARRSTHRRNRRNIHTTRKGRRMNTRRRRH
jgi:hypothetical protein